MLVYAHRGSSGEYPENTMLSFRKAYESGCQGIELDVHLSRDGKLVVIHDERVDRTADAKGFVRDCTLEELQAINVGSKDSFEGIPSFEEYCRWVQHLPIITNIEIKTNLHYYPGIEEKVVAMLRQFDLEAKSVISSFNHASLWKVKALNPNLRCGMLVGSRGIGNAGSYAATMGMEYFHPDGSTLTEDVVKECHAHGIGVNVWTINDMALLKKVIAWGVDGIITNYPDVVGSWIAHNKEIDR